MTFKYTIGRWITNELFYEYESPGEFGGNVTPKFTSRKEDLTLPDGKVLPSLFKLYMSHAQEDMTEYQFANRVLGGWEHWQRVVTCKVMSGLIDDWRKEAEIQARSYAFVRLMDLAKDPSSKYFYTVNKLLLDKGWREPKETEASDSNEASETKATKRGRPSKQSIREAASEYVRDNKLIKEAQELLKDLN